MAIPSRATTADAADFVLVGDPDVSPRDPADVGWIPKARAVVQPGADVVRVRPLNIDERMAVRDVTAIGESYNRAQLERARRGVVAVNGDNSRDAVNAFCESIPEAAVVLLGATVEAVTAAIDPQAFFRRVVIGPDGDASEADDDKEAECITEGGGSSLPDTPQTESGSSEHTGWSTTPVPTLAHPASV